MEGVRYSGSCATAIKLNAMTARASDISANLVIKSDAAKYASFRLLHWRMRMVKLVSF